MEAFLEKANVIMKDLEKMEKIQTRMMAKFERKMKAKLDALMGKERGGGDYMGGLGLPVIHCTSNSPIAKQVLQVMWQHPTKTFTKMGF